MEAKKRKEAAWRRGALLRVPEHLELAIELMQPSLEHAFLTEDHLKAVRSCLDTITIANEPRFCSICCYGLQFWRPWKTTCSGAA